MRDRLLFERIQSVSLKTNISVIIHLKVYILFLYFQEIQNLKSLTFSTLEDDKHNVRKRE